MARAKKRKTTRTAAAATLDATPERLAKGDDSDFVNVADLDSTLPISRNRRFKSAHLDRLYQANRATSPLTYRQWYAGDWYRTKHSQAGFTLNVIASYGERTSSGEPSYGLPRTEKQLRARALWREARLSFPATMTGFMDRLLIHDEMPRYGGRAHRRSLDQIGDALDRLADFLKLEREPSPRK